MYRFTNSAIGALLVAAAAHMTCYGQSKDDFNPIQTGVTSLSIAPDARGASMGDIGAATELMPIRSSGIRLSTRLHTAMPLCR